MRRLLLCLCLITCGVAATDAQTPTPGQTAAQPAPVSPAPENVAPDSPRASLQAFIDAGRRGRWDQAARYLSLTSEQRPRGATLARRLKAVLDDHLWFDFELISGDPSGRLDDGLPPNVESIGEMTIGGRSEPLRLVRSTDAAGAYWAFSQSTVERIDAWYEAMPHEGVRELLASVGLDVLLLPGPLHLLRFQWLGLPIFLFLSWQLSRPLAGVTKTVLARVTARTRVTWDDRLAGAVRLPARVGWALLLFALLLPLLDLTLGGRQTLRSILGSVAVVALFWAVWRVTGVLAEQFMSRPWASSSPSARSIVAVAVNLARSLLLVLGALAVLSTLGFPVMTLLAGLGIGGLALAFGAQKTVENIFGSISLAVDQPFRVGDFVQVDDFVGTVEGIGLRSTRFRTLDRTLITIPNGQLADKRLESFSARDRMRLATTIGLEYGTTAEQMRAVLTGIERALRAHPLIWPDVTVKFKEFGPSALAIEVMAWFTVKDWAEFQRCREDMLLEFMRIVEASGARFAFPTQTVHLVPPPATAGHDPSVTGTAGRSPAE